MVTEGKYFTRPYCWPFPKFSPFLDIFNFYISEFIEKGTWNAIINKYGSQPQVCPDMSGKPIEFANCFTAFLTLICGAILSFLLFGLEFVMKPYDEILDGFRNTFGDHNGENRDQFDAIRGMDRDQLEYTGLVLSKKTQNHRLWEFLI